MFGVQYIALYIPPPAVSVGTGETENILRVEV